MLMAFSPLSAKVDCLLNQQAATHWVPEQDRKDDTVKTHQKACQRPYML